MDNQLGDAPHGYSVSAQTVSGAAWRGRCNIPSRKIDINLVAQSRNNVSSIMSKIVNKMPESLCLEIFPRLNIWPTYFNRLPPTGFSIDLFIFSEGSDENVLDNLLNEAICTDFALKAKTGTDELLIFPSVQLPEKFHRVEGKYYFWGLFIGQNDIFLPKLEKASHIEKNIPNPKLSSNSADRRSFEGINIPDNSPLTQTARQADKRGRKLDDAWKHAKPLDELRQKSECRYCGFVSVCGGISRLKVHLAGGNSRILLPACHKVPPEVKQLMANWCGKWVQKSKAVWVKDHQGPGKPYKRGRPLDDAWEHAIQFDKEGRNFSKCKYCDLVSKSGGIARLKVHLGGDDPSMSLTGCPNAPSEVKNLMYECINKSTGKRKGDKEITGEKSQAQGKPIKVGRPLDDAWKHAIQFDENGQQFTKCKYCDYVYKGGGITRLKVHLDGGDPSKFLKGCPNMSLEVKMLMYEPINKSLKKRNIEKETTREKSQETEETSEAQGSPKRRHILQETLDEGINKYAEKGNVEKETTGEKLQVAEGTSEAQGSPEQRLVLQESHDEMASAYLKATLQKIIDKKKAKLQKDTICMQCGDKGWNNAFVYCVKCLGFAVHRYCLDLLPKTCDEYVCWLCDDCEVKEQHNYNALNQHAIPCQMVDPDISENFERVVENVGRVSEIEEKTSNVVVTMAQVSEDGLGKSYNRVSETEANKSCMVLNVLPYQMGEDHDISEIEEKTSNMVVNSTQVSEDGPEKSHNRVSETEANKSCMVLNVLPYQMGEDHDISEIEEKTSNMVVNSVQVSEDGPEKSYNHFSAIEANKNDMVLNDFPCHRGDDEIFEDIKGVPEIEANKNDSVK